MLGALGRLVAPDVPPLQVVTTTVFFCAAGLFFPFSAPIKGVVVSGVILSPDS